MQQKTSKTEERVLRAHMKEIPRRCSNEEKSFQAGEKEEWSIIQWAHMLTKIPCKGPLIHMQSVTHTHTHSHTLNTGYCNWNKVQRDYDLTPSWPVSLPLLHSLSFFPLFSQTFSTSFAFSLAFRGLEQTDVFTHTHLVSRSCFFYYL